MNCPICGTVNNDLTKFCTHCGGALVVNEGGNSINQETVISNQPTQGQMYGQSQPQTQAYAQPQAPTQVYDQTMQNQAYGQPHSSTQAYGQTMQNPAYGQPEVSTQTYTEEETDNCLPAMTISDYFIYLFLILLKPYTAFKNQEENFDTIKCPAILSSIIAGIMTLVTLIYTMIATVIERKYSYSRHEYQTKIDFSNLADIDYISVIGKNFLIYLAIIAAIAGAYFLGSLVIKREQNFAKLLSISATGFVSFVALGMIAAPIFELIFEPLSILAMLAGVIYSIAVFIVLINDEIKIEDKDIRIYFNVACLAAVGIVGYYVSQEILISSIGNILGY